MEFKEYGNMEGFCLAGHIYNTDSLFLKLEYNLC